MSILVPRSIAEERQRKLTAPLLGVYYGLHDIAERHAAPADLIQSLSKYRRSDVIRLIAWLASWASEDAALLPQNQFAMAEVMLPEGLRNRLREHVRQAGLSPWCVFHRRQLWLLLQMALLACKEDAPVAQEDPLRQAIGECCLMASDLLFQLESKETPGEGPEEANKWMTGLVIPFLDGKDRLEVLARAHSFWFKLPADSAIRTRFKELDVPDFDAAFAAKYGLPLREFFLILFALYLGFQGHALREKNPLLLDETAHLRPLFDNEHVRRALALVSQTPDDLAVKLLGTPRQNWATDSTPLRENPVIQVFEGKYACPDLNLLHRCLTDKVYFLLQKAYADKAFAQLFGYIFKAYVNRLFRRFAYEGDCLVRQFYSSPKFQGTNDEAGDGILVWRRSALVMEYKARLLTTREKYGGVTEATLAGVEDIIGKEGTKKGVYQLAKVIRRLLAGKAVVAGSPQELRLTADQTIHPVLVTYEETVGLESVRQQAEAKVTAALEREAVARDRLGRLLILTVEEVEILEELTVQGNSPEEVIADYAAYVTANPKDRAGSFRSFICNGKYNAKRPSPERSMVQECYHQAMDELGEELKRHDAEAKGRGPTDAEAPAA